MSIFFSNPPWWEGKESRGFFRKKRWRRGVRAGSRWPFTFLGRCTPDNARAKDYMPYPYFWIFYIWRKLKDWLCFFITFANSNNNSF